MPKTRQCVLCKETKTEIYKITIKMVSKDTKIKEKLQTLYAAKKAQVALINNKYYDISNSKMCDDCTNSMLEESKKPDIKK